jgi:hypothetical protein
VTEPEPEAANEPEPDAPPESYEEVSARRLAMLASALANLDDASMRRGIATMRESSRMEVAQKLQLSKATIHLGDALVPLLRRKVVGASADRQLSVAFALVEECNDATIAELGDNSENPSRENMVEVLPTVIDQQGLGMVTLMLAAYAASDAQCQPVMANLMDTDERFALPDPPPREEVAEVEVAGVTTYTRAADDAAQAEKRAQRKAAKAAKREAEAQRREAQEAAEAARRAAQHQAKRQRSSKS